MTPDPSSPADPVVTLRALARRFGSLQALDGIDLEIPAGCVGLLGPNGAGKSTLLKILLGLLPPTSGEALVLGIDPRVRPLDLRRRVGYMPEVDSYVTGLTGVEAVSFAGVLCGLPRTSAMQRAHLVLHYVGLGEVRYRRVEEYSTGMRQRIRLAQALVHDPDLLFLDEPTNGLDPAGREEILEVIRDLSGRHGKNVILCSHLLRDVEATCGQVVLLVKGRVARRGTMEEIRGESRDLLRVTARGPLEAFAAALAAAGFGTTRGEGHLLVAVPPGAGTGPIFRVAREGGFDLRSVAPHGASLEDVFISAVEGA